MTPAGTDAKPKRKYHKLIISAEREKHNGKKDTEI